jgi:hypothetical protein
MAVMSLRAIVSVVYDKTCFCTSRNTRRACGLPLPRAACLRNVSPLTASAKYSLDGASADAASVSRQPTNHACVAANNHETHATDQNQRVEVRAQARTNERCNAMVPGSDVRLHAVKSLRGVERAELRGEA